MTPRRKASLLWGVIAALAFLVLHQAYLLAGGEFLSIGAVVGVTLAVGIAGTVSTYLAEGWLAKKGRV